MIRDDRSGVTLFSFDYPPNDGGIARLCAGIVTGLAKRVPVEVLSKRHETIQDTSNIPTGVAETRVTSRRPVREMVAWWTLLRDRRRATIICGTWYTEGLLALLAGKRNLVFLAHGAELTPPVQRWRRPLWARLQRWTLRRARLVVANSQYTARLVTSSAPGANVVTIPLAVDHVRFAPGDRVAARAQFGIDDPGLVVIGTVTRIQHFKGIDVVLQAIAALPDAQRRRVVYLVGGKGAAIENLQSEARSLGIKDQVCWLGFVPEDDLPDLYRAMDLFALCTREQIDRRTVEGFGMVFLEAQACGTPVVGTRTGGIPDAIRAGEGGYLIDQDDVAELTSTLRDLIDGPARFAEQGFLARTRVEREGTWEHYMQRLEAALGAVGRG